LPALSDFKASASQSSFTHRLGTGGDG
jgi:hypothetical protein